ncbi:uncharacterized protein LOC142338552 [Convolutriloba macropyga]|uniref:uncharacterized protein LOC142338552 n=1 Tax=Convolutriloba macropyga TaxID=536237 RepID=UPI003F51D7F6
MSDQNKLLLVVVTILKVCCVWSNNCTLLVLHSEILNSSTILLTASDSSGLVTPVQVKQYVCLDLENQTTVITCPGTVTLSGSFNPRDTVYITGLQPGQGINFRIQQLETQGVRNETDCARPSLCSDAGDLEEVNITETTKSSEDGLVNVTIIHAAFDFISGYELLLYRWDGRDWIEYNSTSFTGSDKAREFSLYLTPGVVNRIDFKAVTYCRRPPLVAQEYFVPGGAYIKSADVVFKNSETLCVIWKALLTKFIQMRLTQNGNTVAVHSKQVSISATAGVSCLDIGANVDTSTDALLEVDALFSEIIQNGAEIQKRNSAPSKTVNFTTMSFVSGTFTCNYADSNCLLDLNVSMNLTDIESGAYFNLTITSCSNELVGVFRHNFTDVCTPGVVQDSHNCSVNSNDLSETSYDVQIQMFEGSTMFTEINLTSGSNCDHDENAESGNVIPSLAALVVFLCILLQSTADTIVKVGYHV